METLLGTGKPDTALCQAVSAYQPLPIGLGLLSSAPVLMTPLQPQTTPVQGVNQPLILATTISTGYASGNLGRGYITETYT